MNGVWYKKGSINILTVNLSFEVYWTSSGILGELVKIGPEIRTRIIFHPHCQRIPTPASIFDAAASIDPLLPGHIFVGAALLQPCGIHSHASLREKGSGARGVNERNDAQAAPPPPQVLHGRRRDALQFRAALRDRLRDGNGGRRTLCARTSPSAKEAERGAHRPRVEPSLLWVDKPYLHQEPFSCCRHDKPPPARGRGAGRRESVRSARPVAGTNADVPAVRPLDATRVPPPKRAGASRPLDPGPSEPRVSGS